MTKKRIIANFIEAWQPVFDEYPQLDRLPVYCWGRYYKYESAPAPFECYVDDACLTRFRNMLYNTPTIDWELLKEIQTKHEVELWDGVWGDFVPDRLDMVRHFGGDEERGGLCVIIVRKDGCLNIEFEDCDSPE